MTVTDLERHADAAGSTVDRLMTVKRSGVLRNTFIGAGHDYGPLRIYGGHLLGQGLAAAFATVGDRMVAHSLHAYFLKTGIPNDVIGYQVERLRDGRSYATRSVRVVQADQLLMTMTASFQRPQTGDRHQPPMPPVQDAATLARRRRRSPWGPLVMPFSLGLDIDLVPEDEWRPQAPPAKSPTIRLWMRSRLSTGCDDRTRQCVLAYLSDTTLMFSALRPYGNAFTTHRTTSLDHALWFHDTADPAEWLLYDQAGPVAAGGRGLNHGRLFTADGRLVASTTQEAFMRHL